MALDFPRHITLPSRSMGEGSGAVGSSGGASISPSVSVKILQGPRTDPAQVVVMHCVWAMRHIEACVSPVLRESQSTSHNSAHVVGREVQRRSGVPRHGNLRARRAVVLQVEYHWKL
jgi:hypothetical protein